jgi:hypothetical protein
MAIVGLEEHRARSVKEYDINQWQWEGSGKVMEGDLRSTCMKQTECRKQTVIIKLL